jgi:hypothetical protein
MFEMIYGNATLVCRGIIVAKEKNALNKNDIDAEVFASIIEYDDQEEDYADLENNSNSQTK